MALRIVSDEAYYMPGCSLYGRINVVGNNRQSGGSDGVVVELVD
jgi:hypothetical protein